VRRTCAPGSTACPSAAPRSGWRISPAATTCSWLPAATAPSRPSPPAVVRANRTLGVIPAGTLNHFAADLGIPADIEGAVAVLAAGHTGLVDAGTVNGVIFVNNASLGAYPRVVWERARVRRKGLPRLAAMTVAVLRTWVYLPNLAVRMSVDGRELIRRSPFFVVANGEYLVERPAFWRRASVTAGRLTLYVAPHAGRFDVLRLPVRALLRRLRAHDRFEMLRASAISMKLPSGRVHIALDGEIRVLPAPLHFAVKPRALRVIVPAGQGVL
jgi:diacylglycerol kinase family enzyme